MRGAECEPWELLVGVEARSLADANLALRACDLASGRGARALLCLLFIQKAEAPSQGKSLML